MAFLPPVVAEVPEPRRGTVIELDDRSIAVRKAGEPKVIGWLEANGVTTRYVLTDQVIGAGGGRIRCDAVRCDERGAIVWLDGAPAFDHIDVPMTAAPEAFGL